MAQNRGLQSSLFRHYDKALAVVVLLGLLASLFVLARFGGESRHREQTMQRQVESLRPKVPQASPMSLQPYEQALYELRRPMTAGAADTNQVGLFVPESRVWCVNPVCRYPIPYEALVCPVCHSNQPPITGPAFDISSGGDGIPDKWRQEYFGHPLGQPEDHSLADDDADGDGFSNLEEFQARTSPRAADEHPDYATRMRLKEFRAKPFPLVFTSATKMPDGRYRCFFNIKGGDMTLQATENQPITINGKPSGFELTTYTNRLEQRPNPALGGRLSNVNVSEATLRRIADGKLFILRINDPSSATEQQIVLTLTLMGKTTEHSVPANGTLSIRGVVYKVYVDGQPPSVVLSLENISTGKKYPIPQG